MLQRIFFKADTDTAQVPVQHLLWAKIDWQTQGMHTSMGDFALPLGTEAPVMTPKDMM